MTDIGDILEADWFALARYIIERDGEQVLYEGLVEYAKLALGFIVKLNVKSMRYSSI